MVVAASQAQANLIDNGGFETGDFTGWTTGANSFPQYIVTSPVHSGTYAAQIAGYQSDPDTLSQTITDTTLGQTYDLSFFRYQYVNADDPYPISLSVSWDGTTIFSETNPASSSWNLYQGFTFQVVGTGLDTLVFTSVNDPAYTYLDDVSLTATPLPSTWTMLIAGFVGVGFIAYRGTKKNTAVLSAA
jgi:hypothetical protein